MGDAAVLGEIVDEDGVASEGVKAAMIEVDIAGVL